MSVGYLVVAHRGPTQVLRLLAAIRKQSDGPIAVHIDLKARQSFRPFQAPMQQLGRVLILSTRRVYWADYSIVAAVLDSLAAFLSRYPEVAHVKHLSGQDYPIKPLSVFEQK